MPPRNGNGPDFVRVRVKQTLIAAPVGSDTAPVRASVHNPERAYYYVENTGPNLGFFAWDEAFPGQTNRAIALLPGDFREWSHAIPVQAANFASALGTTFAVIEGWPHHG